MLELDMAMNGVSFSHEGDLTASGVPAAGTPFIVQGYLYPAGTFDQYGELSGVHSDGSPEFPNLVMGRWICSGWHLLDGDAPTGPVVTTRQSFDFDLDVPGADMFTTEGVELADWNVSFERPITGGTGRFHGLSGQHTQTYVGAALNITGGFNATFELRHPRCRSVSGATADAVAGETTRVLQRSG
ncbi:MAG: hypothetical protein GY711_01645 [bacterium]|nr:hypothetical protein [bacterium]